MTTTSRKRPAASYGCATGETKATPLLLWARRRAGRRSERIAPYRPMTRVDVARAPAAQTPGTGALVAARTRPATPWATLIAVAAVALTGWALFLGRDSTHPAGMALRAGLVVAWAVAGEAIS